MCETLLLLGGSRYIVPVIEAAHDIGCRVVTCDYLPENIAHKFSDEYRNASIVDPRAILKVARDIQATGIMSFAADPGVVTAAYVAEALDMPFQGSFEAVSILQNKSRFRAFLSDNGFNCPKAVTISRANQHAISDDLPYPVIVKPVDSAGSKGVSRVDSPVDLRLAIDYALSFSKSDECIVEEFIEKNGESSDADGFTIDGRFECVSFTSQLFDHEAANPFTPAAYVMPASITDDLQSDIVSELQRLSNLLNLRSGVFNIEVRVGIDNKPYIMELSPRGGGNRLCEMLRFASDVDLVRASVQAALGVQIDPISRPAYNGYWYQLMLHSTHGGVFKGIYYAPRFKQEHVVEEQVWINPGERVEAFTAANHAFGSVFLRFYTPEELKRFCQTPDRWLRVVVE